MHEFVGVLCVDPWVLGEYGVRASVCCMYCRYVIACNSEWVYTCSEVCITHEGSTETSLYSQDQA